MFFTVRGPSGAFDWSTVDGSRNAPAGVAQFPTLLNNGAFTTILARPPWKVAGVDYAVGPQSTPTKVVGVDALPSGASIGTSTAGANLVNITGNNVVVSGYDFTQQGTGSLATGWAVAVTGNNCTVQNCLFGVNTSGAQVQVPFQIASGNTGLTLQYNTFDGGGVLSVNLNFGSAIAINGPGSGPTVLANHLIQYNRFTAFTEGGATIGFLSNVQCRYNLFDSTKYSDGVHANFINVAHGSGPFTANFNTFYQPVGSISVSGGGNWPGQVVDAVQTGVSGGFGDVTGFLFDSNTCVGIGSTGHRVDSGNLSNPAVSCWVEAAAGPGGGVSGFLVINPSVTNNYVTQAGNSQAGTPNIFSKDATVTGASATGNINMETGIAANGIF